MSDATLPSTGTHAPDFELPDQDATPVRLSDLRGRRVVLYFYPKANRPLPASSTKPGTSAPIS